MIKRHGCARAASKHSAVPAFRAGGGTSLGTMPSNPRVEEVCLFGSKEWVGDRPSKTEDQDPGLAGGVRALDCTPWQNRAAIRTTLHERLSFARPTDYS